MTLLASHDFHTGLENFLDLEELRQRLHRWALGFAAFEELIDTRSAYFEPRLPEIDGQFRDLSARRRLRERQHALLEARLQQLLTAPRPELLATQGERQVMRRLEQLSLALAGMNEEAAQLLRERIRRLSGHITWALRTEYHERLTRFHGHLTASSDALAELSSQHEAFVRTRQAAEHGYRGQAERVGRLRQRVASARQTVDLLIARQGHVLERLAIAELERRADRLRRYEDQARFALAHSYDRAVTEQSRALPEQAGENGP